MALHPGKLFIFLFLSVWVTGVFIMVQFGTWLMAQMVWSFLQANILIGILTIFFSLIPLAFIGGFYIVAKFVEQKVNEIELEGINKRSRWLFQYVLPILLFYFLTLRKPLPFFLVGTVAALLFRYILDKLFHKINTRSKA